MKVGSTFSGVGGLDLGLERAGMSVVWQAEVDEWCRKVLRSHWWANSHYYDDVCAVDGSAQKVELLAGGFPCQDLSIAGKRAGLAGERSGLFFEFARIANELRPTWLLVENVVGLLSSANGRDMGLVLSTLGEIGYGCAWRVLDARYFGVPQRRRRVFIVGCFGDNGEQAVRALGAGGEGDLEAGECTWQETPTGARSGAARGGAIEVAHTLQTTCGDYSRSDGFNMVTSFAENQRGEVWESSVASQLTTGGGKPGQGYGAIRKASVVRRLTPIECERLMSWPDDWTAVDGDKTPDSRRYAACGNGVVSNVAEWIGRRIMAVENE